MSPPLDPGGAPRRIGSLIDQLLQSCPDAVIIVAQIINAANANTDRLIQAFDNAIPSVVAQRANQGKKVMAVDMRSVTAADLIDGLHPTDAGYRMMADLWFKAIQQAEGKGWIKNPVGPDPNLGVSRGAVSSGHCLKPPFWVEALNGEYIATGVGQNGPAKFTNQWINKGKVAAGIGKAGTSVVFADLNGDKRADYLSVNRTSGSVIAYLNTGTGDTITWDAVNDGKTIAAGVGPRDCVRFADIDQDGKDDYVLVDNHGGGLKVWLNQGPLPGGWGWNGPHAIAGGATGSNCETLILADINGDSRPDYIVKGPTGSLNAFLNIGHAKTVAGLKWIGFGRIAGGLGSSDISLADLDGDGRADYIEWDSKGGLTGFLNYRGIKEGQPGWADQGPAKSIALGLGKSSAYCRLADLNGDGKVDYTLIDDHGAVTLYLNKGTADVSVIGDGVRLVDSTFLLQPLIFRS